MDKRKHRHGRRCLSHPWSCPDNRVTYGISAFGWTAPYGPQTDTQAPLNGEQFGGTGEGDSGGDSGGSQ